MSGIIVFFALIAVFTPLTIWSVYWFFKTRKPANLEFNQWKTKVKKPQYLRIALLSIYAIGMMTAHRDYWLEMLYRMINDERHVYFDTAWHSTWQAIIGWDSLQPIVEDWGALIIIYVVVSLFLFFIDKKYNIQLYKNNKFVASTFNLGLYPFIILSFIGWMYKW